MAKLVKEPNHYYFTTDDGNIISTVNFYDWGIRGFDWELMCNLDTDATYRNQGYATKLIKAILEDIPSEHGLYCLVKIDNHNAIKFYKGLGFKIVRKVKLKKSGSHVLMAKGPGNVKQFDAVVFRE